jgi:hypothetical protein
MVSFGLKEKKISLRYFKHHKLKYVVELSSITKLNTLKKATEIYSMDI